MDRCLDVGFMSVVFSRAFGFGGSGVDFWVGADVRF